MSHEGYRVMDDDVGERLETARAELEAAAEETDIRQLRRALEKWSRGIKTFQTMYSDATPDEADEEADQ